MSDYDDDCDYAEYKLQAKPQQSFQEELDTIVEACLVSTILLRTNLPTIHLHVLHLCISIGIVSKSMSTNALSVIVLNEAANIQRYENGLYPHTLIISISLLYPQLTSQ